MKTNQVLIHIRSLALALLIVLVFFIAYKVIKESGNNTESYNLHNTNIVNDGHSIEFIDSFDIEGNNKSILFENKKVILHFWASWCAPCVTEMPELIDFAKLNKDTLIIAISQDSDMNEVKSFIKSFPEMTSHFIILHDQNRSLAKKFQVSKLPESILINNSMYLKKVSGSIHWKQYKKFESLLD